MCVCGGDIWEFSDIRDMRGFQNTICMTLAEIPNFGKKESNVPTSSRKTLHPFEPWWHTPIFYIVPVIWNGLTKMDQRLKESPNLGSIPCSGTIQWHYYMACWIYRQEASMAVLLEALPGADWDRCRYLPPNIGLTSGTFFGRIRGYCEESVWEW